MAVLGRVGSTHGLLLSTGKRPVVLHPVDVADDAGRPDLLCELGLRDLQRDDVVDFTRAWFTGLPRTNIVGPFVQWPL